MYDACPDCDGQINDFGFCEDCGLDYENFLKETEQDWPKSWGGALLRAALKGKKNDRSKNTTDSDAGNGDSSTNDRHDDGWLDIYRENQQP